MSEIDNGRLGLHGTEHSKCNRLMALRFKGLMTQNISSATFVAIVDHSFICYLGGREESKATALSRLYSSS